MKTIKVHKDDYVLTSVGKGYVLKVDNINKTITMSSKETALSFLADTITINFDLIKKVLPKYYYKIRFNIGNDEDNVVDYDYDSLATARKEFKKLCERKDVYNIVLMKYLRKTNEWIDDIDW